jgi:hypothetical protein
MSRQISAVVLSSLLLGCADGVPAPSEPMMIAAYSQPHVRADQASGGNFGTSVTPDEEVMPAGVVNTSHAAGSAIFQLSADGKSLSYKLIVANIENVFQAHIHTGAPGVNGGIVVWLYPSTSPPAGPVGGGRIQGVIADGTITAANLIGALAGQPLSALIALIENNSAYVNVHTNDGVAPANTGPGDYPGGEMRGQVEARGTR